MHQFFRRPPNGSTGGPTGPVRDPMAAAALSVVPGLGQLYNGQQAKGFLFFDVAVVNFLVLWLIAFTEPIMRAMIAFSTEFHIRPNEELLRILNQLHFGTPVSSVLILAIVSFVLFAARDAYDSARTAQRKSLYWDSIIGMPEATSGSYLMHFAMMASLAIIAMFLILPPMPRTQVTDIEFVTNNTETDKPQHAKRQSTKSSVATAKMDLTRPVRAEEHSATAPNRASVAKQSAASAPASHSAQSQPAPHTASLPAPPRPVARPVMVAMTPPQLPTPHAMSPVIKAPTPTLVRPSIFAAADTPTPLPAAAQPRANDGQNPAPVAQARASSSSGPPMPKALQATSGADTPRPNIVMPHGANGGASGTQAPAPQPTSSSSMHTANSGPMPAPLRSGSNRSGNQAIAVAPDMGVPRSNGLNDQTAASDKPSVRPGRTPEVTNVDFSEYMAMLQSRIKSRWIPPRVPESKRVQVVFKISLDGQLMDLRLLRSSGVAESDQAALKAVREAAPFRHLPAGAKEDVDIEFTFDYNVFNGTVHPMF